MYREVIEHLSKWQHDASRMPLMLRGARQTGKTHVVRDFAEQAFDFLVEVNLEERPEYKACFNRFDPHWICDQITLLSGKPIIPGRCLLFIDEIQESPQAIQALRYFKENYPELHVISAGSLLEFAFNDAEYSMPVGRVSFLHLRPLNFIEFLLACDQHVLADWINTVELHDTVSSSVHEKCLEWFRQFMAIGGMPAVVSEYATSHHLIQVREKQAGLLNTYQQDFGKYASRINQGYCQRIFTKAPALIAKHFRYKDVAPDVQARSLKAALNCLIQAGILLPVYQNTATGLPLNAHVNEKKFKTLFIDSGLAQAAMRLDLQLLIGADPTLSLTNQGQLMEQMVGQELLAYQEKHFQPELFFWIRDKKGSQAEVDYLYQYQQHILPLEVKSGPKGKLKSLQLFLDTHQAPFGIKTSVDELGISKDKTLMSIPVYLISQINRLIKAHAFT